MRLRTRRTGTAMAVLLVVVACAAPPTEERGIDGRGAAASVNRFTPELRARVDALKREIQTVPTTADNVYDRVDVLWDWANAFALEGGDLPVNLPVDVAIVRWGRADGKGPDETLVSDVDLSTVNDYIPYIDRYIRELALKEDRPEAIGKVTLGSTDPLQVNSWVTMEQTYTVGSAPIEVGGGVVAGRQWLSDVNDFQNLDAAKDNYLTATTSRSGARLVPWMMGLIGPHGGHRGAKPTPAFKVEGEPLQPGDTLTIVYGDRSGGSRGVKTQFFATDRLLLPLYIDLGDGNQLTPHWPSRQVLGGEVAGLRVLAPSVVAVDEPWTLTVRSEDADLNRARGALPAYQVLVGDREVAQVAANGEALTVVPDFTLAEPGTYRVTVRSADGRFSATSNPVWALAAPEQRVFWGEMHGHTDFAEGQGSPDAFFRYAREDSRLDFATLTEHDFWTDDAEWETMRELSRRSTEDGRMIAFLGYEWTATPDRGGHHNVFFRTPDGRDRVAIQVANRLPMLYDGLRRGNKPEDLLVIPHAHSAGDWTQSDPDLERLAEIYSSHGSFEWYGNMFLRNGFDVGFVGASDDHRAMPGAPHGKNQSSMLGIPGLAAVLAAEKTPDALFDALRSRRTYATSGQRILLDARLNGIEPGQRQADAERRQLEAKVSGTAPIERIDVIRNSRVVFSRDYATAPLESKSTLQVGFESSSEVFTLDAIDNPRPYRIWQGTLVVTGAKVLGVDRSGLDNRLLDLIEVDSQNPNKLRFSIRTRGRRDSIHLALEGATTSTSLRFELEPTKEYGYGQGGIRQAATIPGSTVTLSLQDLERGRLEHDLLLEPHTDRITLQVVDAEAPLDQEFEYTDLDGAAPGDYYYLRVTQLDGARAWTSPWWVGEKPMQQEPTAAASR